MKTWAEFNLGNIKNAIDNSWHFGNMQKNRKISSDYEPIKLKTQVNMKKISLALSLIFLCVQSVYANNVATQVVTMAVTAINELAIAGSAPTLTINSAVAGALPTPVTSSGITYAYTTNSTGTTGKTITGSINSNMPANLTLSANLSVPSSGGGTSTGSQVLSTTAVNLVTAIPAPSHQTGQALQYTFAQTADVAVTASFTRTVTFTMVDS